MMSSPSSIPYFSRLSPFSLTRSSSQVRSDVYAAAEHFYQFDNHRIPSLDEVARRAVLAESEASIYFVEWIRKLRESTAPCPHCADFGVVSIGPGEYALCGCQAVEEWF